MAKLRVLFVPDSIYWVTGEITKVFAHFSPWVSPTIISGPIVQRIAASRPFLLKNIDLVHFLCPYSSWQLLPFLHTRIPTVTTIHHVVDWEYEKHNLQGDALMTQSEEWVEDLVTRGVARERIGKIQNGVDTLCFKPVSSSERIALRRKFNLPERGPVIGFFAKKSSDHNYRKGTDIFEAAIFEVIKALPNITVLIVGPGWQEFIERLRIKGVRVLNFPFVKRQKDLAPIYACLDLYWITSRIEGGPVTLMEAMSSEVPCISTPVGLAKEIIQSGKNSILVTQEDSLEIAKNTVLLLQDSTRLKAMGRAARETILANHSLGFSCPLLVDLYGNALKNFSIRTGQVMPKLEITESNLMTKIPYAGKQHMEGIPHRYRSELFAEEDLLWMNSLKAAGERREAWHFAIKAFLHAPLSLEVWRELLRKNLPHGFSDIIRKIKRQWVFGGKY